jgi:hypothetical protein
MEEPASCRPPDGLEALVEVLAVHRLIRLVNDDVPFVRGVTARPWPRPKWTEFQPGDIVAGLEIPGSDEDVQFMISDVRETAALRPCR